MSDHDPDRLAAASIACALNDDPEGLVALIRPVDADELRRVVVRLAAIAAEGLATQAEAAGASHEQTIEMWQAAILHAERDRGAEG